MKYDVDHDERWKVNASYSTVQKSQSMLLIGVRGSYNKNEALNIHRMNLSTSKI